MKGARLIEKITSSLAFTTATVVTFCAFAYSWSQNALTDYQPLLSIILCCIGFMMVVRACTHPNKERVVFRIKRFLIFGRLMRVRQRHWNLFIAIMFFLIECTPVTHPNQCVVLSHLVTTGLGAFGFFIAMTHTYKKWSLWWWVFLILGCFGLAGFIVGFKTPFYSTAQGEWIFALCAIIWVWVSGFEKIGVIK